jgi:RNA polymerase sigma-70 factor (ECF subfamily)
MHLVLFLGAFIYIYTTGLLLDEPLSIFGKSLTPMQDESELISQLQNGDERAFALVYDNYSAALYSVILKMTRNEALAQDLLQETFISIWKKSAQYDPEKGRFYTWAYRIARHKVLNYLRSEKNLIQRDDLSVYVNKTEEEDLTAETEGLKGAILKLAPHHQKALEMVYFKGFTHQEAHKAMEVPLGTFKSYVHQAMRELRKHYKNLVQLLTTYMMIQG